MPVIGRPAIDRFEQIKCFQNCGGSKIEFAEDFRSWAMNPILTDELLQVLQKISEHYQPPPPVCKRGHVRQFSECSFLLLAVVAVVRKTFADSEIFRLLQADAQFPG